MTGPATPGGPTGDPLRTADFGLPEPTDEDQAFWAGHLAEGEQLVWTARPSKSFFLRTNPEMLLLPFFGLIGAAMLSTGISSLLAWDWQPERVGASTPPTAILVTLAGWYVLLGRNFFGARMQRSQRYALSDRRALITTTISKGASPTMEEIVLKAGHKVAAIFKPRLKRAILAVGLSGKTLHLSKLGSAEDLSVMRGQGLVVLWVSGLWTVKTAPRQRQRIRLLVDIHANAIGPLIRLLRSACERAA